MNEAKLKRSISKITKFIRRSITRAGGTYDAVVVSYGGSGTTLLARVLGRSLRVNSPNSDHDGILHAFSPTHPIFDDIDVNRAIYVYANPPEAILSLFNRNFQSRMLEKLNSNHRTKAEYIRNIRSSSHALTLDELLQYENDPFHIHRHLRNWTSPESNNFPILCVKYDALFESKAIIADFVGRPEIAGAFPERRPRQSCLSDLEPDKERALLRLYRNEAVFFDRLPDIFEVPASR